MTGDHGVGPFALVVTAASIALSVAATGVAAVLGGLERGDAIVAFPIAVAVGPDGVVGRLGGDEFAAVVGVDASGRAALARRLLRAGDLGAAVPGLRASSGLLDITGAVSLDEALRRADHELYATKRVAAAEPLTTE